MRAIFDLKHPAQVRFFGPAMEGLAAAGHDVLVTSRGKDETLPLLDALGVRNVCLSHMGRGVLGMGAELAWRTARLMAVARRFRPHVLVARTGITVGLVARALHVPAVVFDDTEFAWLQVLLSAPLADVVCTGMGYPRRFGRKERRFAAPPHLVYTHPARFTPDPARLRRCGLEPDEAYVVLRVKAWRAVHDAGVRGPDDAELEALVQSMRARVRVVVSSERPLPPSLAPLASPLPVADVLHLLAFAHLYVGEGSCMAAEAACLGTPAIYMSPRSRRGYLDALEQLYGHVATVRTPADAADTAARWMADGDAARRGARARRSLAADLPDPLDFMLDIIQRQAARPGRWN